MIHSDRSFNIVPVFHIGDSYGLFLAHNFVNLEVEENRRLDVQAGFSKLAPYIFIKDFDSDMSGESLISTILVFKVRPYYFFRSSLQPKGACQVL